MVIHEARDPGIFGERHLAGDGVRHAKVVEAEVGGKLGLVVAEIHGLCCRHIGPLREAIPPPAVILGNRVELREVEGDHAQPRSQMPPNLEPLPIGIGGGYQWQCRPLDQSAPGFTCYDPNQPLDRVGGGGVDLPGLRLEIDRGQIEGPQAL